MFTEVLFYGVLIFVIYKTGILKIIGGVLLKVFHFIYDITGTFNSSKHIYHSNKKKISKYNLNKIKMNKIDDEI